jgi:hypothetical protein
MPIDTEVRLGDRDHVVQFYEADEDLVGVVMGYLSGAILAGDTVVLIATAEHCEAFEAALQTAAVDVEVARAEGRLLVEDAGETLARFIVDGVPDPAGFDTVVGGLVRAASAGGGHVRAYGEMVALLWDAGLVTAAIELERLWNTLGARKPFSLFCAYPAASMAGTADCFSEVCHLHSRVLGAAPLAEGEVVRRFARGPQSLRRARGFVAETLNGWGLRSVTDDAVLVGNELAANAVMHAASDFSVAVSRRGDRVRIEVGDSSTGAPTPRRPGPGRLGGRGLVIVGHVATHWGHRLVGTGKVVWADLSTR